MTLSPEAVANLRQIILVLANKAEIEADGHGLWALMDIEGQVITSEMVERAVADIGARQYSDCARGTPSGESLRLHNAAGRR